jgi:hypothetical protein
MDCLSLKMTESYNHYLSGVIDYDTIIQYRKLFLITTRIFQQGSELLEECWILEIPLVIDFNLTLK